MKNLGVLLKGKTIVEVFELLQELKSVKAVAEEIGVTPGAVYAFRSEHNKAFKRLKNNEKDEKQVEVQSNKKTNDYLKGINKSSDLIKENGQKIETINTGEVTTKVRVLENDNKSYEKKVKKLTSEKNKLHGRITLLTEEINASNEEKRELNIEYQKLTEDYQKIIEEKNSYEKQLNELITESNKILEEAKKYREINKKYQNKLAMLSERTIDVSEDELLKIKKELAFYKDHAFMYYEKANEVS